MKEKIIKSIYQSIIKENLEIYQDLFENTDMSEVTDSYWKDALSLFSTLSIDNRKILFKIIEQVEVDTTASLLKIFDEGFTIGEEDIELEIKIKEGGTSLNGDLQDLFLEFDEDIR